MTLPRDSGRRASCTPTPPRGFTTAEVVSLSDPDALGSMAEARAKGRVRIEGRDYVRQDGDVVELGFNV